jgi:uncharacterized protein YhaN
MRFSELHLLRYGRFEDCRLAFPAATADLHIIYGPNEAGKSTTLSAVNDLLFGFPHISPFDFRFDTKLLRIGALIAGEGDDLACVRKKGRSGTLLDTAERVLDEGLLAATLAGYSADGFTRMFSLDHRRLRDGGRAILAASDDVGQAIFAAGSGLIGVTAVLAKLEEEARAIWTRRAGDRRYYVAQRAFDEARTRQKAAQIRPAVWGDLNSQIGGLDEEIARLDQSRTDASRERDRVERRRRVAPHAALYRDSQTALAALGDTLEFPSDASATLGGVDREVAAARFEATRAESEWTDLDAKLASIVVDERLVASAPKIEALRETKGAVDKSLLDLPRRRADLRTRLANLAAYQHELKWPVEDAAGAKARLPQRVRIADVRERLEKRSALDATLAAAVAETAAARERVLIVEAELAELAPPMELAELAASVKFARGLGDVEAASRSAIKEVDRSRSRLTTDMGKLAPWEGDVRALRALVLPSEAQTTSAIASAVTADRAFADANRALQDANARKIELELNRKQLLHAERAIPAAALDEARGDRDRLWGRVKAHLLEESMLSDIPAAIDGFQTSMHAADSLADRRFGSAEQSAKLAALEDEIEHNASAIEQAAERARQAGAEVAAHAAGWRRHLNHTGLTLTPEAFNAWRGRYDRALESAQAWEDAREAHEDLETRLAGGLERVREGLRSVSASIDVGAGFGRLLEQADRLEAAGRDDATERSRVDDQLKTATLGLLRAQTKVSGARAALAEWDQAWAPAIEAAELSADASHAVVRTQLELIDTVRAAVDEILALEQRIGDMEQDVAGFTDDVLKVAAACGVDTRDKTAPALLTELAQGLAQAGGLQSQATALRARLDDAQGRLAGARVDEEKTLARLRPLALIAGSEDTARITAAVQACERARALTQDIARHGEDIVKAGAGSTLERLLTESDIADAEALAPRSEELTRQIAALSDRIAELAAERATAHAGLKRLDVGPDAAMAAADAEQAKSEMALQAEAYVRKRAEIVLLKSAIARYRSEKQNPLLKRASAIFARLTLGRYEELLVDMESDKARLAGVTGDQIVVPVEGMSEGTVDQLFLALRLAAVEEAVDNGARLPFLADDLFINYDDARSAAGFQVLAELAQKTQVLFFTHHQHLLSLAQQALSPMTVRTVLL